MSAVAIGSPEHRLDVDTTDATLLSPPSTPLTPMSSSFSLPSSATHCPPLALPPLTRLERIEIAVDGDSSDSPSSPPAAAFSRPASSSASSSGFPCCCRLLLCLRRWLPRESVWTLRFTPLYHPNRFARVLFRCLLHPLSLLTVSVLLLCKHSVLLYLSSYALFTLYHEPLSLPLLPASLFISFFFFLTLRSVSMLLLLCLRLWQPALWVNTAPAAATSLLSPALLLRSRRLNCALLLLRLLSMLFTLLTTALLIFCSAVSFSSPALLLAVSLLAVDALTLCIPLVTLPLLSCLLPLSHLHVGFPFIAVCPLQPEQRIAPARGLTAAELLSLPLRAWKAAQGDGSEAALCAICLTELEHGDMVRSLPDCLHLYHRACIDRWLERRAMCPLCVQKVSAVTAAAS